MRTEVTDEGLLIPKRFLKGVTNVEIRKEDGIVLVIPLPADDPILRLGQNPIDDDVTDASVEHDKYLYKQ